MNWLEAPLFVDALEDYHPANISDGLEFEDAIGTVVFGMGSSKPGQELLGKWISRARIDMRSNLAWRAIALNQTAGIKDLHDALDEAEKHKSDRTIAQALTIEGYLTKLLKAFADTYKKAVSVNNANTSAQSTKGSTAFGAKINPVNTRGMDALAVTLGDDVFRHFKVNGLGDFLSEKIIQHIFSLRAFVIPADSIHLIVQQSKAQGLERAQMLERLRSARGLLAADSPHARTIQAQALGDAWSNFKNTHKDGANAIRDARLAVVVMLIEGLNFQKLLADCTIKNDAKSWWSLAASTMSISSALFDIASVPAKNILGGELRDATGAVVKNLPGAESWNYQRLKLFGGVLSVAGAVIGVGLDSRPCNTATPRMNAHFPA